MFNLGGLLAERGDKNKARKWLEKAAEAGIAQARALLNDL